MSDETHTKSANFIELGEFVEQKMAELHVPGVAVGIFHNGLEETAGFGITNVDHPLPVDADTLFQIGSISKTVTATAMMRLVEMGKLELEAPVRRYLPELRLSSEEVAGRVTIRNLLTHTGGWVGDYFDDSGTGDDALVRIVERMADLEQLTPLGELWAYNNAGFYLAGRVIEVLTGQTYEAAVQEMIFEPLGMDMSFFFAADAITYRVAAGHNVVEDRPEVARPWWLARAANPVGGIISTVRDQLRYARFHMGDGSAPGGTRLLSAESLRLMREPLVSTGRDEWVGLSWFMRDAGGRRLVSHGGATKGQMATLIMAPEEQFAIGVLTNANVGSELHHHVTDRALQRYLGIAASETTHVESPEEMLAACCGRYAGELSDLEVSRAEGGLVLQVIPKGRFPRRDSPPGPTPPPVRLAFYGEDRVVALDPPMTDAKGDFIRNADGTIAWFRFGGRTARRQE